MPAQTRKTDNCTGHDACPPRPLASGSDNVIVNGLLAGRVSVDNYALHGCIDHAPHSGVIVGGSPTVFINGYNAGEVGNGVSCGSSVMEGSPNVFLDEKG